MDTNNQYRMARVRKKIYVFLSFLLWQAQLVLPALLSEGNSNDVDNETYAEAVQVENTMENDVAQNITNVVEDLDSNNPVESNSNLFTGNETVLTGHDPVVVNDAPLNSSDIFNNASIFGDEYVRLRSLTNSQLEFIPYSSKEMVPYSISINESRELKADTVSLPIPAEICNSTMCNIATAVTSHNASSDNSNFLDKVVLNSPFPLRPVAYRAPSNLSGSDLNFVPYSMSDLQITPYAKSKQGKNGTAFDPSWLRSSRIKPRLTVFRKADPDIPGSPPEIMPENPSDVTSYSYKAPPNHETMPQPRFRKGSSSPPTRTTTVHPSMRVTTRKTRFRSKEKSKKPTKGKFRSARKSQTRTTHMTPGSTLTPRTRALWRRAQGSQQNLHSSTSKPRMFRKARKSIIYDIYDGENFRFRPAKNGGKYQFPDMFFPFMDFF